MRYIYKQRQLGENLLSKGEYQRVTRRENYSNSKLQYTKFSLLPKRRIITKKKKKKKKSLSFFLVLPPFP
jgi:hypothetical protein